MVGKGIKMSNINFEEEFVQKAKNILNTQGNVAEYLGKDESWSNGHGAYIFKIKWSSGFDAGKVKVLACTPSNIAGREIDLYTYRGKLSPEVVKEVEKTKTHPLIANFQKTWDRFYYDIANDDEECRRRI